MALAPFAPTLASLEMIIELLVLHPLNTDLPCSNSLLNFQSNLNLEFFVDFFTLAFLRMSNFLASGISSMVFEHLQDFFDFKN